MTIYQDTLCVCVWQISIYSQGPRAILTYSVYPFLKPWIVQSISTDLIYWWSPWDKNLHTGCIIMRCTCIRESTYLSLLSFKALTTGTWLQRVSTISRRSRLAGVKAFGIWHLPSWPKWSQLSAYASLGWWIAIYSCKCKQCTKCYLYIVEHIRK